MSILKLAGVEKSYGKLQVLHGIDAEIEDGEIYAIIGPNGAGKTTTFKVMTGEADCQGGTVIFDGTDVTHAPAYQRTRAGMGRTFQVARVFSQLTTEQNVIVAIEARQRAHGGTDRPWWAIRPSAATLDEVHELLAGLSLHAKAGIVAKELSHGDRKRLELGITLAGRPKILMMDEPTAGMSPSDRAGVIELIRKITAPEHPGGKRKLTVVMTEHDMSVIFGLADRIMVMNQGRKIAEGGIDEIRNNREVQKVYLGKEVHHD